MFEAKCISHNGQSRIAVYFEKNPLLIERFKKLKGAKWSASLKAWHLPFSKEYLERFGLKNTSVSTKYLNQIHEVNYNAFEKFVSEVQLRGYSANTLKTYKTEFAQLLILIKDVNVNTLTLEQLRSYFLYCAKHLKLTENQIHSRYNAVKFYFEKVIKRETIFIDIPRPKKPSKLPKVINSQDIKKMLEAITNLKHQLMLKMAYGMGLRVSEIVALKIVDIDSKRMQVLIERSKGKKDRYVNLPESVLEVCKRFLKMPCTGQKLTSL